MNDGFLVEMLDGTFVFKALKELRPDDKLVFDGPNSSRRLEAAQAELEAEIAAAGGLDAWRAAGGGQD